MTQHEDNLFPDLIDKNAKIVFASEQNNIQGRSRFWGKLRYWWCWVVASVLLLSIAPPVLLTAMIFNRPYWVYPWAFWGAGAWLWLCGAKMNVSGLENLDPARSYVLASNHRSYLDTAALFICTGRRIGLVAKKELLKVPIFGYGMGFVNILAIDRSNPQRAIETIDKARTILGKGFSFGIFVEGTRAMPGELLPFKKGAFHLAMQTDAAIIPIAIKNTDWMMGKKQGLCFPGTIEITIFPAVETKDLDEDTGLKPLVNNVRGTIARELARP
jgi:1-acyl-sn-glycerol-3-phosphate acyltransferase